MNIIKLEKLTFVRYTSAYMYQQTLNLTNRQQEIFGFIRSFFTEHGFPPTLREIGGYFKIAPSSVLDHLKALERKKYIRRIPLKPRCLEILK